MLRLANRRRSNLTEASAKTTLAGWVTSGNGERKRKFDSLTLERDRVVFMPLQWGQKQLRFYPSLLRLCTYSAHGYSSSY